MGIGRVVLLQLVSSLFPDSVMELNGRAVVAVVREVELMGEVSLHSLPLASDTVGCVGQMLWVAVLVRLFFEVLVGCWVGVHVVLCYAVAVCCHSYRGYAVCRVCVCVTVGCHGYRVMLTQAYCSVEMLLNHARTTWRISSSELYRSCSGEDFPPSFLLFFSFYPFFFLICPPVPHCVSVCFLFPSLLLSVTVSVSFFLLCFSLPLPFFFLSFHRKWSLISTK